MSDRAASGARRLRVRWLVLVFLWAPIAIVADQLGQRRRAADRVGRLHDATGTTRRSRRPARARRASSPASQVALLSTVALAGDRDHRRRCGRGGRRRARAGCSTRPPTCGSCCRRWCWRSACSCCSRRYDVGARRRHDRDRPRGLQLRLRDASSSRPAWRRSGTTLEEAAADLGATPWRRVPARDAAAAPAGGHRRRAARRSRSRSTTWSRRCSWAGRTPRRCRCCCSA